jgi:hypothetical protein
VALYDELTSLYDDVSVYDSNFMGFLDVPLAFGWGLEQAVIQPLAPDTLRYFFQLQVGQWQGSSDASASGCCGGGSTSGTKPSPLRTLATVDVQLGLSKGQGLDNTFIVPAGAVDFPLSILNVEYDFVYLETVDGALVVKFNDPANFPMSVRVGGRLLADSAGITSVLVSNGSIYPITARLYTAAR